jgi:PAS domain S-box-containing protein
MRDVDTSEPERTGEPGRGPHETDAARSDPPYDDPAVLYRLLVESVRDYAVFVLDPTGRVLTWNPGAERFKGYRPEEIIGRHFSVFYPQSEIDRGVPQRELVVAAAEGRFEDEGWRLRKDGTRFWANVVITALRDPEGELVGFAKVTRDLTERKAAELRAIADARRVAEAEASNRAKADFLAALSHELRTPLNAIGGYVDLLALGIRGPVTPQQVQDLERIRGSQLHLLGIINDLLNFSRIEGGRVHYQFDRVPLREILDTVRSMAEPLAAAKGLAMAWPTDVDAVVHTDAAKAEQVLFNLLTNAVKFTDAGGQITIDCNGDSEYASVAVTDTGTGIPVEQLDRIFDPFVQVGRTHTSLHEGTGLGLAISRDLTQGMGGRLTVRSVLGSGSTFTLELPREPVADDGPTVPA